MAATSTKNTLRNALSTTGTAVKKGASSVYAYFSQIGTDLFDIVKELSVGTDESRVGGIKGIFTNVYKDLKRVAYEVKDHEHGVSHIPKSILQGVSRILRLAIGVINVAAEVLDRVFADLIPNAFSPVTAVASAAFSAVTAVASTAKSTVSGLFARKPAAAPAASPAAAAPAATPAAAPAATVTATEATAPVTPVQPKASSWSWMSAFPTFLKRSSATKPAANDDTAPKADSAVAAPKLNT